MPNIPAIKNTLIEIFIEPTKSYSSFVTCIGCYYVSSCLDNVCSYVYSFRISFVALHLCLTLGHFENCRKIRAAGGEAGAKAPALQSSTIFLPLEVVSNHCLPNDHIIFVWWRATI